MPYAPGITYQAPNITPPSGNTSNWGAALMQFLGEKSAKDQAAADLAKKEASDFKTYVAMGKTLGIDPNELTTKDLPTVKGIVEGHIAKTKLEEAVANFERLKSERTASTALEAAMRSAGSETQGVANPVAPGLFPEYQVQQPVPVTPERLLAAISQNPQAVNSPQTVALLNAMRANGSETPMGFGPQDVIDLGKIDPRLEGQFQVRQSRGSFQNLSTVPRTQGLPVSDRMTLADRDDLLKRRRAWEASQKGWRPGDEQYQAAQAKIDEINLALQGGGPGAPIAKVRSYNSKTDTFD